MDASPPCAPTTDRQDGSYTPLKWPVLSARAEAVCVFPSHISQKCYRFALSSDRASCSICMYSENQFYKCGQEMKYLGHILAERTFILCLHFDDHLQCYFFDPFQEALCRTVPGHCGHSHLQCLSAPRCRPAADPASCIHQAVTREVPRAAGGNTGSCSGGR